MLCESCKEREARVFMTAIIDGEMSKSNLCQECFETEQPAAFAQAKARMEAGCHYCGARVGQSVCQECAKERNWFMDLKGFTFQKENRTDEEQGQFTAQWLEVMEHMQQWVAERKIDQAE